MVAPFLARFPAKKKARVKCIARFPGKKIYHSPPPEEWTPDSLPSPPKSVWTDEVRLRHNQTFSDE